MSDLAISEFEIQNLKSELVWTDRKQCLLPSSHVNCTVNFIFALSRSESYSKLIQACISKFRTQTPSWSTRWGCFSGHSFRYFASIRTWTRSAAKFSTNRKFRTIRHKVCGTNNALPWENKAIVNRRDLVLDMVRNDLKTMESNCLELVCTNKTLHQTEARTVTVQLL